MRKYSMFVFHLVFIVNLQAQSDSLAQSKTFDDIEILLIKSNTGNYSLRFNFIGGDNFICNKNTLLLIIESLKAADTKKEYHNFFRLKSSSTQLKLMVRHDKKSDFIDVGEFRDFQKGNEKKILRTNAPAFISYLEECYEVIKCN